MRDPACCVASGGGAYIWKKIALAYNSSASFENCTSKGFGALRSIGGGFSRENTCTGYRTVWTTTRLQSSRRPPWCFEVKRQHATLATLQT